MARTCIDGVAAARGELAVIERIRMLAGAATGGVRLGIGDDCAILRLRRGEELLVTTDFSLEGRHFRRDWHTAESAGHRCLARGLSDLAAMGGRPLAAFLSLALPRGYDAGWLEGFLRGMFALAGRVGVPLAGGDTAQAPGNAVLADIVLTGGVSRGRALLRSGAAAGQGVYVTGTLGGAARELRAMTAGPPEPPGPQSFPEPRLAVGQALVRRRLATACMDLSDGLSADLAHLCAASGVGAAIGGAALPIAPGATLDDALHGGEDYELLFAATVTPPARIAGVRITRIGTLTTAHGITLDGAPLKPGGWEHLADTAHT